MKLKYLLVAPFILIGCGDDTTTTGSDATTTTTTDTSTDTTVTPGTSAVTGVNTNVTKTNPNPTNANCDLSTAQNNTTGAKYPWGGLTVDGVTYTCNGCPNGYGIAQGKYRLHGFATSDGSACNPSDSGCDADYNTPDAATDLGEILFFDGNTWYDKYHDAKAAGGPATVESRGWYFCAMKPEHANAHTLWVTTEVSPTGSPLGGAVDEVKESDPILGSSDNILIFWYNDVNASNGDPGVQYKYCKFGVTDTYGHTCADPF